MIDFWAASAQGHYVAPGFLGNDPERFWTDDATKARRFATEDDARTFTRRIGDASWGWKVERVFRFECNDEDCPEYAVEHSPYCAKHDAEYEEYLMDQAEKAAFDRESERPDYREGFYA